MKRMIIKYWYVPIVVVALLMLSLIVLITIQSAFQRITFWFLFIALITLPFSWICLLIFKERRKALLSVLWSIAAICILLIPLLIAIISDPHVPNSSSDQSNQNTLSCYKHLIFNKLHFVYMSLSTSAVTWLQL